MGTSLNERLEAMRTQRGLQPLSQSTAATNSSAAQTTGSSIEDRLNAVKSNGGTFTAPTKSVDDVLVREAQKQGMAQAKTTPSGTPAEYSAKQDTVKQEKQATQQANRDAFVAAYLAANGVGEERNAAQAELTKAVEHYDTARANLKDAKAARDAVYDARTAQFLTNEGLMQNELAGMEYAAGRTYNAKAFEEKAAGNLGFMPYVGGGGLYAAQKLGMGAVQSAEGILNNAGYMGQMGTRDQLRQQYNDYLAMGRFDLAEDIRKTLAQMETEGLQTTANFADPIRERLENTYSYVPKTDGLQIAANAAEGIGGMVPSMASAVLNPVAPGLSLAVMGMGAAGNATKEALNAGADDNSAYLYGGAVAAIEMATEKIADGVAGVFGKGAADDVIKAAAKKIAKTEVGQNTVIHLANVLGEGFEEWIAEYAEAYANKLIVGQEDRTVGEISKDAIGSFAMGALISVILSGASITRDNAAEVAAKAAETTTAQESPLAPGDALQQGVDTTQAENGVQTQKNAPIQVGRVTTIQNPYSGDVPVQTAHTSYTQEVSDAALKTAETNLQTARAASTMNGGKGIKTLLTNIYKQTFKPSLGVAVNGMTFHGQPYLVDVNSNVPGKVISDPNLSAEKLSLLEMLPTVVQNGEYVGSGEYINPGNSRKEVIRYDYFECPVTINGVSYIATFDVQVEPGTNNYRTHKVIKMDLTDASAARTAPAAGTTETNLTGPIGKDGGDPITSDNSVPQTGLNSQETDIVNEYEAAQTELEKINNDYPTLTTQEAINDARSRWEALYQYLGENLARYEQAKRSAAEDLSPAFGTSENHIDNRSMSEMGDRRIKAFQFDHPELHEFFAQAAQIVVNDAAYSSDVDAQNANRRTVGIYGNKRYGYEKVTSESRVILEGRELGISRPQLIQACTDIIANHGQENYAVAKRVELLLDKVLSDGYTTSYGEVVAPNSEYLNAKSEITGGITEAQRRAAQAQADMDFVAAVEGGDGLGAADAGSIHNGFYQWQSKAEDVHSVNEPAAQRMTENRGRVPTDIPKVNPATDLNISKTVSTILNSELTTNEVAEQIELSAMQGDFDYHAVSDKTSVAEAERQCRYLKYQDVARDFINSVQRGRTITKQDMTNAYVAYSMACEDGNAGLAFELSSCIADSARTSAQVVQSVNILNRLTPAGKLLTLRRFLDKLNIQTTSNQSRSAATAEDVDVARSDFIYDNRGYTIDEELATQYLLADTDEARAEAWDAITSSIAAQMPSTFMERVNFWRYTSMLTNPTTHIRNMLGNVIQMGSRSIKNAVGAMIEPMVVRDQSQRTKSVLTAKDKALRSFAETQYAADQDMAMGGGKYSEASMGAIAREINSKKKAFKGKNVLSKGVQAIGDFNTRKLDAEDVIFNKPAYIQSFAQALKAKGVTEADIHSGSKTAEIDAARQYAIAEAQKATYRNMTAFSEAVSGLGKYEGNNWVLKAGSFAADALLPFRRTPANILTTGLDYSPVGLLKALKQGAVDVKAGNCTAADVVDSVASGLTGTGIMALGALLAKSGLLSASLGDDKKEQEFNKSTGEQVFSIKLGNTTYTLDWMVPAAIPLFAGATMAEGFGDSVSFSSILDALTQMGDVVLETSMLSTLSDVLDNISYAESKPIYLADKVASSYLGQFVPTVGSKVASVFDDTVRKSYVEKGKSQVGKDADYFLQSLLKKIPGARNTLQPAVDVWGREVSNGGIGERVVQALISPGKIQRLDKSDVSNEVRRLAEITGRQEVYPSVAPKYFTKDKVRYDMTAEEYTAFSKMMGRARYNAVQKALRDPEYQRMSDDEKAAYLKKQYDAAYEDAKDYIVQLRKKE